jgi:hypothetical protein
VTNGNPEARNVKFLMKIDKIPTNDKSRDSAVCIALGYGLDDWGSRVRFPAWDGNFSPLHRVQTGSGAHQASYLMDTGDSSHEGKAAGVRS